MLLRAIGRATLTDPRDEILIHHVRRDPTPGARVANRTFPRRDLVLNVRLALFGDAREMPRHAERVVVVDRHAPFRVT